MPNTREKLIELCEDVILSCKSSLCDDCEHNGVDYPNCMGVHFADHLIGNGVTIREWISVKDRLPKGAKAGETSENVIALTIDGEVTTGWMDALGSDKWWLVIGTDDTHTCWGLGYVTHWMPLPQPPKGE